MPVSNEWSAHQRPLRAGGPVVRAGEAIGDGPREGGFASQPDVAVAEDSLR